MNRRGFISGLVATPFGLAAVPLDAALTRLIPPPPIEASIASRVAAYWTARLQRAFVAVSQGVFG